MANEITGEDVHGMAVHWLGCPVNGYLGSPYGADPQALLQKPLACGLGDAFVRKMEQDIPILQALPGGAVDVHFENVSRTNDRKRLVLNVMGSLVSVDSAGEIK